MVATMIATAATSAWSLGWDSIVATARFVRAIADPDAKI
jgi:hypothetical protein